jgi:hypothetical protein
MTRLPIAIVVLLSVSSYPTLFAQVRETWSVSRVLVAKDEVRDQPEILWMGLRNESQVARLVCVSGWAFTIKDGERDWVGAEGSPHACNGMAGYTPVLPRETRFIELPLQQNLRSSVRLSVDLFVSELRSPELAGRRELILHWAGDYSAAMAAAHSLFPRE